MHRKHVGKTNYSQIFIGIKPELINLGLRVYFLSSIDCICQAHIY